MRYFSWRVADGEHESIPNIHSGAPVRPVYLLQPNGAAPIEEPRYEGFGTFGGVNAYTWLARTNAEANGLDPDTLSSDQLNRIGVGLALGNVLRDTETGEVWYIFHNYSDLVPGNVFSGHFDQPMEAYDGQTANELVASGRLERVALKDITSLPYPLKFSFDSNAVYEELEASRDCEYHGYFYPDLILERMAP